MDLWVMVAIIVVAGAALVGLVFFVTKGCGIRGKAASDSDARRPLIPIEAGQ